MRVVKSLLRSALLAGCVGAAPAARPAWAGENAPPAQSAPAPFPAGSAPGSGCDALPAPAYSAHLPHAPTAGTEKLLPIDLPYALRLANAANPTIALARERVAEAYAVQRQTEVMWLPDIWLGGNPNAPTFLPAFYHHDGLIQNSAGLIEQANRDDFFLQAGASLNVSLADAVFAPRFGRAVTAAARARAQAVSNDVQLDVALAYLELLRAYGALAINDEAIRKADYMYRAAASAFRNGKGKTGADPNRAKTEVEVRREERFVIQERAAAASARLAQLLLLDPSVDLLPGDRTVVPISLVPPGCSIDEMIATALMNRPELAENRALIAQAVALWRQAQFRPLIPILQANYWGGQFGGGFFGSPTGANTPGWKPPSAREDVSGQLCWQLRNLGFGDLYRARETRSRVDQANIHMIEVQAQIAAEVTVAAKAVRYRAEALRSAQIAVRQAEEMWRKLVQIAFGVGLPVSQFDPLEPFLAERALLEARNLYLDQVIEYNRNQFRLYWAMGQPPAASLPGVCAPAVVTPVMPSPTAGKLPSGNKDNGGQPQQPQPPQNDQQLPMPRP